MHIQTQAHTQNNVANLKVATIDDIDLDLALADLVIQGDKQTVSTSLTKFNYASIIAEPVRKQAQDAAVRIRDNIAKTQTTFIEIGRDLLATKKNLAHGAFGQWIEAEFDMNIRSAQNMMNAAELANEYKDTIILPQTVIYKLAAKSTPTEVKANVATQIKSGTIPTTKEIEHQIAQAKEIEQKRKEVDQQQKADERVLKENEQVWLKREGELRKAGQSETDIDVERKKWDVKKAKNESSKLKRKKDKAQMLNDESLRQQKESAARADLAVEFLKSRLGADFAEFRAIMTKKNIAQEFYQELQAA